MTNSHEVADAVVIGGGSTGTSIAYALAQRGIRNVALVEKNGIGAGGTGRSSAIIRQHYTLEAAARMARLSLEVYREFRERVGGEASFVEVGYLLGVPPEDVVTLRANVAMLRSVGVETWTLTPDQMMAVLPWLSVDDLGAGAWEPRSGYADPVGVAQAYAVRAREAGARLYQGEAVREIEVAGGRVCAVKTETRRIATGFVVDAAGLWAADIGRLVGHDLPIRAVRHQICIFERPASFGEHPVFVDAAQLAYFRPEGRSLLLVGESARSFDEAAVDPDRFATGVDPAVVELFAQRTIRRFPIMEQGGLRRGYAGCYDMTPDGQFILDQPGEPQGFFIAAGLCGHGFKHAPAIGLLIAEWIVDGRPHTIDLRPFRLARFTEGETRPGERRYSRHLGEASVW